MHMTSFATIVIEAWLMVDRGEGVRENAAMVGWYQECGRRNDLIIPPDSIGDHTCVCVTALTECALSCQVTLEV